MNPSVSFIISLPPPPFPVSMSNIFAIETMTIIQLKIVSGAHLDYAG